MAKWLLVVESHCTDPAREKEFRDWYDNVHFKDIFKTREFAKAMRAELHQASAGAKDKVLAIYEIEADDVDSVMARHNENMKRAKEEGRMSPYIEATARGIYKVENTHSR